jgi:hypothetical protein
MITSDKQKLKDQLAIARKRHGKPFAYEPNSEWKPRQVPLLTEWMQNQSRGAK